MDEVVKTQVRRTNTCAQWTEI